MADKKEEESPRPSIFRDTPNAIKTLRRVYKDRLKTPDRLSFQAELSGESDRASVLLMTATLEDALAVRIAQTLSFSPDEKEFDHIFRFEGPLGTFSNRLEIACLFGIIEDETYQELDVIRDLRNACAHSKHAMTFSDLVFVTVTKRLFRPLGFTPQPDNDSATIKGAFILEGMFLLQTLLEGTRAKGEAVIREQLKAAVELKTASAAQPPSPGKPK